MSPVHSVAPKTKQSDRHSRSSWQRLKQTVLQFPGVRKWLVSFQLAGADTDRIIELLVLSAQGKAAEIRRRVNRQRRRLKLLADRLEAISVDLKNTISDPETFPQAWLEWLTVEDGKATGDVAQAFDARLRAVMDTVEHLQQSSRTLRLEERQLAAVLKFSEKYAGPDACIASLVEYIYTTTGTFHDEMLANLLQAAHDALNSSRRFSAEMLRKFRQRHVGAHMGLPLGAPLFPSVEHSEQLQARGQIPNPKKS